MIIPVGERYQQTLYLMKKKEGKLVSESLQPTVFVPMTGKAEDARVVKPDPKNPAIANGDFEVAFGDPLQVKGWHYQRQLEVVTGDFAPSGKRFVRFHNADSGRGAQALQAFAARRPLRASTASLRASAARTSKRGLNTLRVPLLGVTFYDEDRATIGERVVGPWTGTSDWKYEMRTLEVPVRAREALIRIGLFGATGEISYDDISVKGLP